MSTILWLKPDEILVAEDRQRKAFDEKKIESLAKSIEELGQINPILVEMQDGNWSLVAGERRLRAGRLLSAHNLGIRCGGESGPSGYVPCLPSGDLDEVARYALELEENIQREDLTWQERATAIHKLHEFRQRQSGGTQTLLATAAEIGNTAPLTVADALVVVKHLADPEVAKAKTQKEAVKIIQKKAEIAHRVVLAQTFDLSKTEHKLHNEDVYDLLPRIATASCDCIITDPPYGVGADGFGSQSGTGHTYQDSKEYVSKLVDFYAEQFFRIGKSDGILYLFCDIRWFEHLDVSLTIAGWNVWPKPLIWDKCGTGMLPEPDFGPRYTYECILFARKGDRKTLKPGAPDVLRHAPVRNLVHGAQKPVSLYVDLLSRVCLPGQMILDCFGGSGPVLPAANMLKLTAVYNEKDPSHFATTKLRINEKEFDNGSTGTERSVQPAEGIEGELVIPGL